MVSLFSENRNTDVLIFGLDTGRLKKEFSIGALNIIPDFNLEKYLQGYNEDDIGFIIDYAKFGQFRPKSGSEALFFSPFVDDVCLLPFRLFKTGWLSAITIAPVVKMSGIESRSELNITRPLFGQIWADRSCYEIDKNEVGLIQKKHQQLLTMPKGYLEMALRRFSKCYKYIQHSEYAGTSELDDYWIDLVIALESITGGGHGGISRNMQRRTAFLLGQSGADQERIKNRVREIYKQRCSIVHGEEKDEIADATHEKRFLEAEVLRSLTRDTINACIELLIDASTFLLEPSGHRKTLAQMIDERIQSTN